MSEIFVVLGNQLFSPEESKDLSHVPIFMAEDEELCTYHNFHKHKIILFLASMRHYRDELLAQGRQVVYHELSSRAPKETYEDLLERHIKDQGVDQVHIYEI